MMRILPSTTVGVVCVLLRSVVRSGNGLGVTGGGLVPGAPAAGRSGLHILYKYTMPCMYAFLFTVYRK